MMIAQLIDYYQPGWIVIKTSAVISTTIMIMEMGTSEKVYIKTASRIVGVIAGVILGMTYAVSERSLASYLNVTPPKNPADGPHPREWILILFRVAILVPTIFVSALFMKIKGEYSYGLTTFAVHVGNSFLAQTLEAGLSIAVAALLAVATCVVSLVAFEKFTTATLMMDTNRICIHGVLSVVQLSITSDPETQTQFATHCDSVHKSISSAESAHETYEKWRRWTCRTSVQDFKALVKQARPLYYQAYSLYWGNVSAYHAAEYKSEILFCNELESYLRVFKPLVDELVTVIERIKDSLSDLYGVNDKQKSKEEIDSVLKDIIANLLWNGLMRIQQQLKREYLRNRKSCFSTIGQRWNMADYLRQLAMMTLGVVDYVRALINIFQKDDRQIRLNGLLDELAIALDGLRKEEESTAISRTRFGSESVAGLSKIGLDPLPMNVPTSVSSPFRLDRPPRLTPHNGSSSSDEGDANESDILIKRGYTMGGL